MIRMETRPLSSHSEIDVSVLGLGTMTFGAESGEDDASEILDMYYEAGGRFVDTADVYSDGASESIIGNWLASRSHQDVVVATKSRFPLPSAPDSFGAGRAHVTASIEGSLQRLGVDVIDLYQVHAWDPNVPVEETFGVLDELVAQGKARAIGVSNYLGWHLERAVRVTTENGWVPVSTLQPQYNLLDRQIELDVMPVALDHGMGLLPWSPLGGGWLTGKYSREQRPAGETRLGEDPNRGVEAYDRRNSDRTWRILDAVEEIAREHGVAMLQVALNWLRRRPGVVSTLLGARNASQLEQNLAALEWQLDDHEMDTLNGVSAPGLPDYPHRFLAENADVVVWNQLGTV